jgi:hypothetical protein
VTAQARHDLRLAVLILGTVMDGLGSVITVLGGDDALSRAKRDVEDVFEREKKKLEAETFLESQATFDITEAEGET